MTKLRGDRIEQLLARARREVDEGLLPGVQLALAVDGEVQLYESFGDASSDTRFAAFSATKAFVAGAVWVLIGEGSVDPAQRVTDHIPEFGTNGKEDITVEQVMLHTSGFPHAPMPFTDGLTSAGRTARFAEWRLNWEPGSAYEYHATSAHWVLAEIIERVSGQDYRDFVQQRVTKPAGIGRRVLGLSAGEQSNIAELVNVGDPPTPAEIKAVLGLDSLPVTEVTPEALVSFNQPGVRAVGVPGGGGFMTAADLATYYQALLLNPGDMWDADVLRDATGNVRSMLPDRMLGVAASRSLGLIISGEDGLGGLRGFGKTGSPRMFGHGGAGGQIAWADPETGLSFAYMTNGLDQHVFRSARRTVALSSIAAECA